MTIKNKLGLKALAEKVSEASNQQYSVTQAKEIIKLAADAIVESCGEGVPVTIIGFGTFEKKHYDERNGVNPSTKEKIVIPAHDDLRFKSAHRYATDK